MAKWGARMVMPSVEMVDDVAVFASALASAKRRPKPLRYTKAPARQG
jgi:hypothetical protein